MSEKFDESKIPDVINKIRQNKQRVLGESKIVELTKKFQFEKYAFSRLTENENFEHARLYSACFYLNNFKSYKMRSKISEEIWLRNEGLPNGEGMYQLYLWFCKGRGYMMERVIEDLERLGEVVRKEKCEEYRRENEWREKWMNR